MQIARPWHLGLREFRVRHYDTVAWIEPGEKEMAKFWTKKLTKEIVIRLKTMGYQHVILDLEGYRSGSMNEILTAEEMRFGEDSERH